MTHDIASGEQPEAARPSKSDLDQKVVRGYGWIALAVGSKQALAVVSMVLLARLLEPESFGLVALAAAFLAILSQIQQSGVGSALIQRRTDLEEAAASALLSTTGAGVALCGLTFAIAPLYARVFDAPDLADVVRVMSLLLVIRGLGVVPGALLEREVNFAATAKCDVAAVIVQYAISIALAVAGFGVWSLVLGHIAGSAVGVSLVWLAVPWRPSPRNANWTILREMVSYGRFVGASNVVTLANNTLDNVFVGKLLGTTALGFYAISYRLANFPTSVISFVIGKVMFPVYSILQRDPAGIRQFYVENLQRNALLALPLSVGLVLGAEPIVLVLLGDGWLPAVDPLRILAVYGLVKTFTAPSGEVFRGIGRPGLGLAIALPHAVVLIPAVLVLTPRFGLTGAATGMLVTAAASGVFALALTMRLIELRARELAKALARPILCSALLALALGVLLGSSQSLSAPLSLALLAGGGFLVYAAATALFARNVWTPLWLSVRGART